MRKELLVFIGTYEDNIKYQDLNAISFVSNNLQKHLIESFKFKINSVALLFSPQTNFLKGGRFFFKGKFLSHTHGSFNYKELSIPYININPLKPIIINLTMFLVLFSIILFKFRRVKVVTYNASIYLTLPLILAKLFGVYDTLILADIPPVNDKCLIFSSPFSNTWILLARLSNRFITFNKNSLSYMGVSKNKSFKVVNFPSPEVDSSHLGSNFRSLYDPSNVIFTYTGSISDRYGIRDLIKLFENLPNRFNLRLYGKVDIEDFDSLIRSVKNVHYMGYFRFEDVIKFQIKSDFLIVYYKDEHLARVGNSGRLIEYFVSGVPIISNVHDIFSSWILEFINPINFTNISDFVDTINTYSDAGNYERLLKKATEAQNFILENSYNKENKEEILKFLLF
jgi:hypothetical protein